MFSEDKVTEIFCLADEFCKFFDAQQEKSMLEAPQDGKRRRRKPNRMSDAEIILIMIIFHSGATNASNITIWNMSASIWHICFHGGYPTIDLWNWKGSIVPLDHIHQNRIVGNMYRHQLCGFHSLACMP